MNEHYIFRNMPLPYDYAEMEPYIDAATMEIHHNKHLQTYVNNLNNALRSYPMLHNWSLEKLITQSEHIPSAIRKTVKNNAGGVYNHQFYFEGLANRKNNRPVGELAEKIDKKYGSFQDFKDHFKTEALSVFGSGYAWLVLDPYCRLKIITTANQDTPLSENLCPLLNVDVWEHAYYLKHYNLRADYIADWFQVIDWDHAEELYLQCKRSCYNDLRL